MHIALLSQYQLLAVGGEDAVVFLQGLISNDARKPANGEAIYATLLTPQGKFLHDFFLLPYAGNIGLICDRARADDLRKRFNLYKLRSKVTVEPLPENLAVYAMWGREAAPAIRHAAVFRDPRLPEMGYLAVGDDAVIREWMSEHGHTPATQAEYDAHRMALGVPQGGVDLLPEKSFLLEWGIDQLHGVDYQKGCYVGQEVTARTHYRGQVKKAPYLISSAHELVAPATIRYAETEAGDMRSASAHHGLALLRIEWVEQSRQSGVPLTINGQAITATLPPWYRLPETSVA